MEHLSELQKEASRLIGKTSNFVAFMPTEYAQKEGYSQVILPLREGRRKWQEYREEGLDELFHYHEEI
jgi:hypothetical protein